MGEMVAMITPDDVKKIIEIIDERCAKMLQEHRKQCEEKYVWVKDCDERQKDIISRFANDDKRIELLVQQQRINNWLTSAIAAGIVALLIKVFLGG